MVESTATHVVRFSPFATEKLIENAQATWDADVEAGRDPPRYGISVIAAQEVPGAGPEQCVAGLCERTRLKGRSIATTTQDALTAAGYVLMSDPDGREPDHHLIAVGDFSALPNVEALNSLLSSNRRRNPAWTRGVS